MGKASPTSRGVGGRLWWGGTEVPARVLSPPSYTEGSRAGGSSASFALMSQHRSGHAVGLTRTGRDRLCKVDFNDGHLQEEGRELRGNRSAGRDSQEMRQVAEARVPSGDQL